MYNLGMALIFIDIDGTIIDTPNGLLKPTLKTKLAFDLLKKNNHKVFIASGRAKALIDHSIIELNSAGYITCNGAKLTYMDQVLYERSFNDKELAELIKVSAHFKGILYLESDKRIYASDLFSPLHKEFDEFWKLPCPYHHLNEINEDIHIAMMFFKDYETALLAKNFLAESFDIRFHNSKNSFDVNIKGVSKATPITFLKELFKDDRTYALGDGENDIEMLETVDVGIAMGNCATKLLKAADEVTLSVLEDGVYEALKKHVLF